MLSLNAKVILLFALSLLTTNWFPGAALAMAPMIHDHGGSSSSTTGKVEVSGEYGTPDGGATPYGGANAVSWDPSYWVSQTYQSPAWISYEFTDGGIRAVQAYRILFTNGENLKTRAPKRFEFQVQLDGNDDASWKTVDYRCCETNWDGSQERTYRLSKIVKGTKFRILFHEDNDNRADIVVVSMQRFEILGKRDKAVAITR